MSDKRTLFPCKSGSVFDELCLEGKLCDAVIKVQDVEFPVHKMVLCHCSSYFRSLFERWMTTDKVFNLSGLSPDTMQLIIEFAYTGSVNVTEDNVQDLLLVADMLNVMDLIQVCTDFLNEMLRPEKCIGIWRFAKVCPNSEMQCKAFCYITDHFEEVFLCEEFLELSVQDLTEFLGRDDLNVRKESNVFEAILRWIDHIPGEREEHIAVLLSKVRLALTSVAYIWINVLTNQVVCNNSESKQMAKDAMKHMIRNRNMKQGFCNPYGRPRVPNAIMLASGGLSDSNPIGDIEAYDPRSDVWIKLSNKLKHPLAYHGTAFLDGYFYCIGGSDTVQDFSSVYRLDMRTHTWHEVAPMHNRRTYVSVTVLDGFIYALGGSVSSFGHSSAERYDPEANQWTLIASMQEQRCDASCTSLHGKIYICGGCDGFDCLQSAECYDPGTNLWTMIAPMINRRSGGGVVAFKDQIYAVGGFNGEEHQRWAESYDPSTNSWQDVCPLLHTRREFGLEVIEDRILAVGGFADYDNNDAEAYCSVTGLWTLCCGMKISRSALSCCVVQGIPNMADYTFSRDSLPLFNFDDGVALDENQMTFSVLSHPNSRYFDRVS
ncbi:kelch-like protein 10 [Scophthalmus maximus]|uniref:kelch-like protein 10 n=1 Tax=Scophthalmus maximus TaxID=52904 RepID=UPI001FA88320|nr:kelch-like protein 10 [Scophthalmus maximus]